MNNTRFISLKLACGLIAIGAACAQDPNYIADLKTQLNFSSWPGQSGPSAQGLNFQLANYPALAGLTVSSDTFTLDYLTYGLIRNLTLTNGTGTLTLKIGVGIDSASNGHELFLRSGPADSDFAYYQAYQRGDTSGIAIGDLNFVPPGAAPSNLLGYIAFLRRNVFCILADDPVTPTGANLNNLATELDANINAQSALTTTQFESGRPVSSLIPLTTSLSSSAQGSTTASVHDTDPTGSSGPIVRQFVAPNLQVQDPGGEPATITITATSAVGSTPLELVAVNAFLQFGTTTVTFVVTP